MQVNRIGSAGGLLLLCQERHAPRNQNKTAKHNVVMEDLQHPQP